MLSSGILSVSFCFCDSLVIIVTSGLETSIFFNRKLRRVAEVHSFLSLKEVGDI